MKVPPQESEPVTSHSKPRRDAAVAARLRLQNGDEEPSTLKRSPVEEDQQQAEDAGTGNEEEQFAFTSDVTLEQVRADLSQFAEDRDWDQFHTVRNLVLAMVGEVSGMGSLFLLFRSHCALSSNPPCPSRPLVIHALRWASWPSAFRYTSGFEHSFICIRDLIPHRFRMFLICC